MSFDLNKLTDDELRSIASGNLKDLPEETQRLISGAKAPTGSAPPIGMDAAPAIEEKFDKDFQEKKAQIKKDQEAKAQEITTTSPFTLPGLLSSPTAAIVTGAGLLTAGYVAGKYGPQAIDKAKGAYKSIKERFMASPVDAPVRIEPIGFESFADMTPTPTTTPTPNPLGQTNLTPEDIQARAAQLKAVAPEMPVSTPISAAPVDAPAPTPSAQPNSPVTSIVTDTVKELIQEAPAQPVEAAKPPTAAPAPVAPPQDLRTGTGKPAFAGMGPAAAVNKKGQPKFKSEYADINAVPRGYAFVPGADKIDTLRNTLGQQAYTEAFKNLPFPSSNEMAMQQASEINRMLGRPTRAELIAAGLPPAANTPGITQFTNPPKGSGMGTKTTRVAGTIGALVAIPNLVNAAQQGNYGGAALQAADVATDYLPFVGQVKQALSPSSAGAGSDMPPSMAQAMLLGSPYAQSPLAVKQRQALEYERKVGAGRGIAPPSAYLR